MAVGNKEKQQILILGILGVAVLAVAGYVFRGRFLPKPTGTQQVYTAPVQLQAGTARVNQLLKRPDYGQLEKFGEVPVEVRQTEAGTPFRVLK